MVYPRNTVYSLLYVLSDMGCFYPARIRSFGMGCILQTWCVLRCMSCLTLGVRNSASIWSSGMAYILQAWCMLRCMPCLILGALNAADIRSFGMVYPRNTVYSLLYVLSDMGCFYPARVRSFGMGCTLQAWCMFCRTPVRHWVLVTPRTYGGSVWCVRPTRCMLCCTPYLIRGVFDTANIRSFGMGCILQAWCMLRRMSCLTPGARNAANIWRSGMAYPLGMVHASLYVLSDTGCS